MRPRTLTTSYIRATMQHAPAGSRESQAIAATVRTLLDEDLPLPGPKDVEDLPLPWRRFYARPVKGTDLAVIYELSEGVVVLHSIRMDHRLPGRLR